jgi:ABC-type glycerol-3-phosphate transport system substrate-binding protein
VRKTRVAAAIAVCALGAGGLAACGSGSSSGKTTITFMEAMSSGTLKTSMETLTKRFEKAHPDIDVQLQVEPDYGTLRNKETAALSASKPPTIGQVYSDWAATFAKSNVVVPLTDYAKPADLKALYPSVRDDLYLPADHKLYMWPFNKSVVIQYYNTKMLSAKGKSAPKTWDEFAATARAVSGKGNVGIAIDPGGSAGPAGGEAWFEILSQAYGTPVFAADGKPQFTSPAAIKAMNYLVGLKKAGALTLGKNYPGQVALGAGKGGFDISSVASYYYNSKAVGGKFPMGTAPLPTGPGGTQANQMAGTNIVMFAKASDAERKAAWSYLKFLTSADSQAYWAENSGYLPVTPAALPKMTDFIKKNPYQKFAAQALTTAKADPPYPWISQAQGMLAVAMQSAITGKQSASAALGSAQQQAVDAMKSGQ